MRKNGSVTVTFSIVFLLMFSFVLSFFEMAAYTARSSFHAAAARLATENFFAGYTAPLYSEYHIFGKEVPAKEEVEEWAEQEISRDVAYMTQKKEDQKSLLLRSGAEYSVLDAKVLTQSGGEGFYRQAVRAMQYRSVAEVAELVKQYLGLSKQMEGHMTILAQQAEVAGAYATVEKEILKLIELVDGVQLSQYELFLRGQATVFQADSYVKHFCTDLANAEKYFERAEVYRAFCENYTDPYVTLTLLGEKARLLSFRAGLFEQDRSRYQIEQFDLDQRVSVNVQRLTEVNKDLAEWQKTKTELEKEQKSIRKKSKKTEEEKARLVELEGLILQAKETISTIEVKRVDLLLVQSILAEESRKLQTWKAELDAEEAILVREYQKLREEETAFLQECSSVRQKCAEAVLQTEVVKQELSIAILAKERCDAFLESMRPLLGDDAIKGYTEELEKYRMYESAEGYDFSLMVKTLRSNRDILGGLSEVVTGMDSVSLLHAAEVMEEAKKSVRPYSFAGLRLNYGEISLAGSIKDQLMRVLENAASNSFLTLLTEETLADGQLELSYLPSGFRYAGTESAGVLAMLGKDLSEMIGGITGAFSQEGELSDAITSVTDPLLFHAYLMTHFQNFSKPKEETVLRYEVEYLIAGKAGDRENLADVLTRIIFLRTAQHLVSLYSDSERKAPVEAAAFAACGAIGLPALKAVLVFLFLLIWAIEEAFVDASALLLGTRLSFFPGKNDGSLTFPELLLFSKTLVRTKAKAKKNATGVTLGYQDYLQLYLLMTPKEQKCYRAMDLVQENLRSWYKSSFRLKRCVWSVEYLTDGREYVYSYE